MDIDRRTLIAAGAAVAAAPAAHAATPSKSGFPRRFLWGAATAGHQIEGNNVNADNWVAENTKPTAYAEPSGDACNSFELWPQDLDLVKAMGLNTYRFSLEWSRIEPEMGRFSPAMLDHYKAIVAGCHRRGLTPMLTFNHYTTPRWFAARGGWTAQDAADLFGRFCDRSARHLADGLGYATTLNEPNLPEVVRAAIPPEMLAKLTPVFQASAEAQARAAGSKVFIVGNSISYDDPAAVTANKIAGHRAGRAAIKAVRGDLPVGVSLAIPDDQALGEQSLRDTMRARQHGAWLEAVRGDDFLGVQNYERAVWDDKGKVEAEAAGDRNLAGTPIFADSLANAVRYAYGVARVPIIVTEHGVNTADDAVRARFIPAALRDLKAVMDEGVPVQGYIHWSLLDNFEWIYGYKMKYGLVAVDRMTFARTPKASSRIYGAIARRNAL
ncbi:family 1 glycosylhydrolase [Caulobacter rhizosphaerae]|uniref:family 1 glycosylhydrolase n=1 Tax=Caulobacter rhizosphaerae TaxID=2010972 RepID=UPI0013D8B118|nr:family 1 glycosylhydrolase [Caulobacter rhizosphaerae]GGL35382.1 beta-glucosidase [Caulobacter rhizosphaerae]